MIATEELAPHTSVSAACRSLGVPRAALYRRRHRDVPRSSRSAKPSLRKLCADERSNVLETLHSSRFMDKSPGEIYAILLDEGTYLCSERTMYRILEESQEVRERRAQLRHPKYAKPELLATAPNQVWSWDITKLKGPVKWSYFHLYVILDIFSRYVVGWMVAERESATLASRLIQESCKTQFIPEGQLTLHADRGSSMRSKHVAHLLADLGITKTHSRPHVSNDNPYSESQFKTLKYCPTFPGFFGSIQDARAFCSPFFSWYNNEHRHSGVSMLTPDTVHYGRAERALEARHAVLSSAQQRHPERFVRGAPRQQRAPQAAWINPPAESSQAASSLH